MKTKLFLFTSFAALILLGFTTVQAGVDGTYPIKDPTSTLVETVRQATEPFKNASEAGAAGYGLFHGCVSGPQEGAMGIHLVNGDLVGDGALDPTKPEALLYEFEDGQMQLTGVEYVVIAEDWHAHNEAPPVLRGQVFNYVGSPNRYGIPAFYELHVWAWKNNPLGTFSDWNPKVSCDSYTAEDTFHAADNQASARADRSPVDNCANLPPNGPVSCTNTRKASAP